MFQLCCSGWNLETFCSKSLGDLMPARPGASIEEPALRLFSLSPCMCMESCCPPSSWLGFDGVDHIHRDLEEDQSWVWISFFPQHLRLNTQEHFILVL